jgi:hypothetical protein
MTRIPSVKTWRVRFLRDGRPVWTVYVRAPTKTLAKLAMGHGEHGWTFMLDADEVRYSVVRERRS